MIKNTLFNRDYIAALVQLTKASVTYTNKATGISHSLIGVQSINGIAVTDQIEAESHAKL